MKYKVGDKVKIRSDLEKVGNFYIADEMLKFSGEIVTITKVDTKWYKILESRFMWTDEMIEGKVEDDMEDEDFNLNPFKKKPKKKLYKGWELLKAIADGEIKEGKRFINSDFEDKRVFFYTGNDLLFKDNAEPVLETMYLYNFLNHNFELIEEQEEINIQDIEEIYVNTETKSVGRDIEKCWTGRNLDIYFADKINELIKAIKQKEKKDE